MQYVFTFVNYAIVVRHWFEVTADDEEHGARIEVREIVKPKHRGSESAAQVITCDRPVCRVDLFERFRDKSRPLDRAHYHPVFDGIEPSERVYDPELSQRPGEWIGDFVENLQHWLGEENDPVCLTRHERQQMRDALPVIKTATDKCLGENCTSDEMCYRSTSDVNELVLEMMRHLRNASVVDDPRVG